MAKNIPRRMDLIEKELHRNHFFIGYFNRDFPLHPETRQHDFHQVLWIIRGAGRHHTEEQVFDLRAGDLLLIPAGQTFHFAASQPLSGYLLCFRDDFLPVSFFSSTDFKAALFHHLLNHILFRPGKDQTIELEILFRALLVEYHKKESLHKKELLLSLLRILFIFLERIKMASLGGTRKGAGDYRLFLQFLNLLETDFSTRHEVAAYAEALQISARKLSSVCRRFNGRNAKELIEIRLIAEAKSLLQAGALPVKEVAQQTGFPDQYQFSKFFKKQTGLSPLKYKQHNKK